MKSSVVDRRLRAHAESGVETSGLPAIVTSARTRPSPGVEISSASPTTGSSPKTSGRPLTRLAQRPMRKPLPEPPVAGGVALAGGGEREHRAALAVEVAGEVVEDVDEPARERAEALGRRPDPRVDGGALGGGQLARHPPDLVGLDPADRRDRLGR